MEGPELHERHDCHISQADEDAHGTVSRSNQQYPCAETYR